MRKCCHCQPSKFSTPARIWAQEGPTESLMSLQVVEFGKLSFADQIRTVHDAAVLAGISGSDLINAIFLPRQGVLVEMNPLNRGAQVYKLIISHQQVYYLCHKLVAPAMGTISHVPACLCDRTCCTGSC